MDKKGKTNMWAILGVVAVVGIAIWVFSSGVLQTTAPGTTPSQVVQLPTSAAVECPTDKAWSGTVTMQNILNTSGAETFDTTMYLYEINADGSQDEAAYNAYDKYVTTITDTTSGSLTATCGKRYAAKVLSVSGAAGDQAAIKSVLSSSGTQNAKINSQGLLVFTATSDSGQLQLGSYQQGNPQIRVFDIENNGYMFSNGSASATAWNATDGVNFAGVTNAGTNTSVGSGGSFNIRFEVQSQNTDETFNDQGLYVLVDAASNRWATPIMKLDGSVLSDIKTGGLNPDEVKAYTGYEYVYLVPKDKALGMVNPNKYSLEMAISALAGIDPVNSDTLQVDLAPVGSYASVSNSNFLKIGSVKDDSSQTVVHTLWDTNFWIN